MSDDENIVDLEGEAVHQLTICIVRLIDMALIKFQHVDLPISKCVSIQF